MRDHPSDEGQAAGSLPPIWTGRATNHIQWALAAAGAGCMALGIELAVDSPWTSGTVPLLMSVIGCVAAGLLMLFGTIAFVHVAVTVDRDAVEVRCGHMGVPRRRIPLATVVAADFDPRVTPCQWGGWGCRWHPERGTAFIVRRGEGVVLTLDDGKTFTVTVDDAETAVRIIRDHLRTAPTGSKTTGV
ncbi:hypothetical protein [Streptomyces formicae]|uniref:Lipoprotein n=1 Tax=Streptomyces formicae TaxID=1616117 RepID=A0ABY3WLN2_9ACTN|nr:hypothetical protein [Streptomyces formicae]UNM13543.1 hypothetical protein J4032_20550 [Streptomyces formicae]